jgi:hypothetical protein
LVTLFKKKEEHNEVEIDFLYLAESEASRSYNGHLHIGSAISIETPPVGFFLKFSNV